MRKMFVGVPFEDSESSCGYCSEAKRTQNGMWAIRCEPEDYQEMIDRGWRRSGCYCYRPLLDADECCKLFTIRLPVEGVVGSKSQKKKLRRFVRGVSEMAGGWGEGVCDGSRKEWRRYR